VEFDASGLLGRALQHEVDHLNGILFTDRMTPADREALRADIEALRQPPA
jgi:peptide deformylase